MSDIHKACHGKKKSECAVAVGEGEGRGGRGMQTYYTLITRHLMWTTATE